MVFEPGTAPTPETPGPVTAPPTMRVPECPDELDDPFRCPTKEETLVQTLALLPRGRAWQSHDASTSAKITRYDEDYVAECGQAQCGDAQAGQIGLSVERTVLSSYWGACAGQWEYVQQRACALLNEFFCETISETRDVWSADYGFPDDCDPWDDLCQKVAATGGSTCDYITWAASLRGWTIECADCNTFQLRPLVGCMFTGLYTYSCGDCDPDTLYITIDVANSPSYKRTVMPSMVGCSFAGCLTLCGPDPQQVECLIERIKPAHVVAVYNYVTEHDLKAMGLFLEGPELGLQELWTVDPNNLTLAGPVLGAPTLTEN